LMIFHIFMLKQSFQNMSWRTQVGGTSTGRSKRIISSRVPAFIRTYLCANTPGTTLLVSTLCLEGLSSSMLGMRQTLCCTSMPLVLCGRTPRSLGPCLCLQK
jgi:hypothetical protein